MITTKKLIFYLLAFYIVSSVTWTTIYIIKQNYSYLNIVFEPSSINRVEITTEKYLTDKTQGYRKIVPRIIHQTYKNNESIPLEWQKARNSCLNQHPHWEYRFYSDEDMFKYVEENFPEQMENFLAYPQIIQRVDAFRYMLLYKEGGVYLDFDIGCKRKMDDLLIYPVVLPKTELFGVSNDFMISAQNHPFFEFLTSSLASWNRNYISKYLTVMLSTGPMFLSFQLSHYLYTFYPPLSDDSQSEYLENQKGPMPLLDWGGVSLYDLINPAYHHADLNKLKAILGIGSDLNYEDNNNNNNNNKDILNNNNNNNKGKLNNNNILVDENRFFENEYFYNFNPRAKREVDFDFDDYFYRVGEENVNNNNMMDENNNFEEEKKIDQTQMNNHEEDFNNNINQNYELKDIIAEIKENYNINDHSNEMRQSTHISKKLKPPLDDNIYILSPGLYSQRNSTNSMRFFYHIKGKSWHSGDARWIFWIEKNSNFVIFLVVILVLIFCVFRFKHLIVGKKNAPTKKF